MDNLLASMYPYLGRLDNGRDGGREASHLFDRQSFVADKERLVSRGDLNKRNTELSAASGAERTARFHNWR
jgi:hypothetical protein